MANILLVQEPSSGVEIQETLSRSLPHEVSGAASAAQALSRLRERRIECDLVIAALSLAGSDDLRAILDAARQRSLPVIVLAGADETARAIESLEQGVADVVLRTDDLAETLPRLARQNLEMPARVGTAGGRRPTVVCGPYERATEVPCAEAVAGLAHQINNPLTTILGSVELLQDAAGSDPGSVLLERIRDATMRCRKTLAGVSSLFSSLPLRLEVVDWAPLLEEAVEGAGLRSHASMEVLLERSVRLPAFRLDRLRMRAVLTELLSNANDAVTRVDKPCVRVQLAPLVRRDDSKGLMVRVVDNGVGIDPAIGDRLFDPFFTTEPEKKIGLGLNLARAAVLAHGGVFRLASRPSGWTEAAFELPWTLAKEDETGSSTTIVAEGSADGSVLVVDDEHPIRELVGRLLRDSGYRVRAAASVTDALSELRREPARVVVTDLKMPGLGGRELFECLESCGASFVFMTGDTMSPESSAFLARGFGITLPKPFTRGELLDAVKTAGGASASAL
jgi:signal transduction histidine kinase